MTEFEQIINGIDLTPYRVGEPNITEIGTNASIIITTFRKGTNYHKEVVLKLGQEERVLGSFSEFFINNLTAKYKNGRILICYEKFDRENTNKMQIVKVLDLYDVADDTFYSVSEKEALMLFDPNIDNSFVTDSSNKIVRCDITKKIKK